MLSKAMLEIILMSACTTFIITYSTLFDFLRQKFQFFKCPLCVGFWTGLLFTLGSYVIFGNAAIKPALLFLSFKAGLASSIVSFMLHRFLTK